MFSFSNSGLEEDMRQGKSLTGESTAADDMALQMRALTSAAGMRLIASRFALAALLAAQGDLLLLGGSSGGSAHYTRVTFRPQHWTLTVLVQTYLYNCLVIVISLRNVSF